MPTPELEPQLKHHLLVIQRRWWAIATAAVLAFAIAWFWQTGDADRYEAKAQGREGGMVTRRIAHDGPDCT